ncbi:MAG: 2-oxoacid:acceptor oxidoreductase subunit alpha [Candidatus Moraniibacteriota bacterium]|nr:MAG: 2-oxoacid:acceptor oxidoreductase subunit alpha [Candidatus Moranbacteria bacterium]
MRNMHNDISIVLAGAAGKGVQTVEGILLSVLKSEGYPVFASKEYMSRVRGGSNSTEIRIGADKPRAYRQSMDICFPFDRAAFEHLRRRMTPETLILADERLVASGMDHSIVHVPISSLATELGNPLFENTVAAGVILGILGADISGLDAYLQTRFASKGDKVVEGNIEAGKQGYKIGQHLAYTENLDLSIRQDARISNEVMVDGTEAIAMGAIAGGCSFIASYPMSPSTGVLQFLAKSAETFGIAVEQAEDEIAAINMGLGASYAGARAMVTTSGGGFALMCESVSLAGMMELPIVIHIAQRPGPATGLPTRTEQGDLELTLYAGHGEFPRAIFSPGTHEEAFETMQQAFRMAEKWQSPVFLLSDQYFLDTVSTVPQDVFVATSETRDIIETSKDYERYTLTENGVSPRGIPGWGEGLVVVDSDEHTEDGHLTERLDMRVLMMDKRMKKLAGLAADVLLPVRLGAEGAETILVGWGSTHGAIAEALEKSGRTDIAYLHFRQIYPLPVNAKELFKNSKNILVIENNYSGQFASLLEKHGISVSERVVKYDGEPFGVEELTEKISSIGSGQ